MIMAGGELPVRPLSPAQLLRIQTVMHGFVEDDLDRGVTADARLFCDACRRGRPVAGFIRYARYQFCNACATDFEVGQALGRVGTPGQYVRDRQFGEEVACALPWIGEPC